MMKKSNQRLIEFKQFSPLLEQTVDQEIIIAVERQKRKVKFDFPANPQQGEVLKNETIKEIVEKRIKDDSFNPHKQSSLEGKTIIDVHNKLKTGRKTFYDEFEPMNDEVLSNQKKFGNIKQIEITPQYNNYPRRVGVLGFKVGMMSTFDKWGCHIPLTVIQIDRCQVVQIKETKDDNKYMVQIGGGGKSMRTITKAEIGHYLKNNLPPNRYLREFKVTKDCLLPIGFRLGPRHFTPGQIVDVRGEAKDKGFSGAMKRWGFRGQPASHGVSVSHRSLGSTGQCQWPSRVFKGKRMHGHMGGHTRCQLNLKVFKIDYERSLLYLLGSVPGKAGELIEIQDSRFAVKKNMPLLNFPTFIAVPGKQYANIVQMDAPIQDPSEEWLHENALPKEGEDEEAAASVSAATDLDD